MVVLPLLDVFQAFSFFSQNLFVILGTLAKIWLIMIAHINYLNGIIKFLMLISYVIFYYVLLYIAIKFHRNIAKKIWKKDMIQSIFTNVAN